MAVGEVGLCAITRTVYAEAAGVLADYLAPHQVAVGVPGGLDILVHGVRAFLRAQPEHVVVHRRWGSVFWRSWARVIRGRLPAIGRPNADILNHGPPPAYEIGRAHV